MSGTTAGAARRMPIVAGNWKMHYGPTQAREFAESVVADLAAIMEVESVVCPPTISITAVHNVIQGSPIKLGAQNMYFAPRGAFTGETSPTMLQGLCDYVILGHSERRGYFGETDELVNRKTLAAFEYGLRPIVCVGERLEDRDANLTERVITAQMRGSLSGLPADRLGELVVAYEPIWAIGTGRAATAQDAADVVALIRAELATLYSAQAAASVRVQYGGSVTSANIADFAANPDIDGALVGGASLTPDFVEIVRKVSTTKK
ncbi:MAG TPA: triose-phosphate isomerase [Ktedonobacterales bacterium]|nr:triose-phosphate isomerase [Ktedonobacterales bacterium]